MEEPVQFFDKGLLNQLAWYNISMMRLPEADILDHDDIIAGFCADKVVLDIGCVGDIKPSETHFIIESVASSTWGVDIKNPTKDPNIITLDIDKNGIVGLPDINWEMVVCSEIIEHLKNPGNFLESLRQFNCDIIITTPNPLYFGQFLHMLIGIETGNAFHFSGFTVRQFSNLARECGFDILEAIFCTTKSHVLFTTNPYLQPNQLFRIRKYD